jgi:signal transduction histidine kinase
MTSLNGRVGGRAGVIGRAADGRVALSGELASALDRVRDAARAAARAESHERRVVDLKDVMGEARLALALSASIAAADGERPSDAVAARSSLSSPPRGISTNEWLVRSVVHDLNNMLLVIQNCNEVMRQQPNLLSRESGVVHDAVTQATRLVAKLLPADDGLGQPAGVDLSQAVMRFSGVIRALIGSDIAVVTRLASDLPLARCEDTAIARVLSNLATNARDAMPNGGTLTLETLEGTFASAAEHEATPGTFAVLSVADTGRGMDGETRERAFEPFFSTKGTGSRTGVGLTAVRELVQDAGGFVELDSGVGRGTTVRVYLRLLADTG